MNYKQLSRVYKKPWDWSNFGFCMSTSVLHSVFHGASLAEIQLDVFVVGSCLILFEYESTALTSTVLLQGEREIWITFQIQLMANISVGEDVFLFLGELLCGNWAKDGNQSICMGGDLFGYHYQGLRKKSFIKQRGLKRSYEHPLTDWATDSEIPVL